VIRKAVEHKRKLYGHGIEDTRSLFVAMDADKSGMVSTDEMTDALHRLGLGLSPAEVSELLNHMHFDENRDGEISYEEFAKALHGHRHFQQQTIDHVEISALNRKPKFDKEAVLNRLREAKEMLDEGLIERHEFEDTKKEILSRAGGGPPDLTKQLVVLEKQIAERKERGKMLQKQVVEMEKKNTLLDGKMKKIQSNFNRIHDVTLSAQKEYNHTITERLALEREMKNMVRRVSVAKEETKTFRAEERRICSELEVVTERTGKLQKIVGEFRRKLQAERRHGQQVKVKSRFLVSREKTVGKRVDQAVASNANAIMKIEGLLKEIQTLNEGW